MRKPNNYDNTQTGGEFEPLKLGGHVCKIIKLEETKSSTGKDMLKIALDIAEGEQVGYYRNQFNNDAMSEKKWGCMAYVLVEDNEGNTNKQFKSFCESVEKSNGGFAIKWGEDFSTQFGGKLVGGVFGREQYLNGNNELKFSTKCRYFTTADRARKGIEAPKDKLLNVTQATDLKADKHEDEDLPF